MNTPYYLVEEAALRRNLALIKDVADRSGAEIILAFKAFALWKTFPIFREYISHTTASSPDEARLAFEEFGSPAHTYSPAYTERDFPTILRCSSHITFNSLSQFHRFAPMAMISSVPSPSAPTPSTPSPSPSPAAEPVLCMPPYYGGPSAPSAPSVPSAPSAPSPPSPPSGSTAPSRPSLGLRVNPEYSEIETELYNPCAPGSRFGVLADDLPATLPSGLDGFHIHCHCESSAEAFARTLTHIEDKFSRWFPQLKWINFGGGHLMTRKDYNIELLVQTLRSFHARYPHLRMILEPGSAFAWQTGDLFATVVDIVENHGIRTAILDVSFTCHMPDCLEMPYYPEIEVRYNQSDPSDLSDQSDQSAPSDPPPTPPVREGSVPLVENLSLRSPRVGGGSSYRLGGNSCLSGDFMGTWLFPRELHIGDEIVFKDMIHYTTVKTTTFNGIHHPTIAIRTLDGEVHILREFTYEDYRNRMD